MTTTNPVRLPTRAGVLGRFAHVRPHERRPALGAFVTLFGFMAGHALLETARDAVFLASWPASHLPWVYLGIAVLALTLSRTAPSALSRLAPDHELSGWLVFAALGSLGLWAIALISRQHVAFPLYVWTGVLATLVVVRFWTLVSGTFTVTQAKRLFAVIGSGSVLGAIAGSAIARSVTEFTGPRHLVLVAAAVFALTALATARTLPLAPGARPLAVATSIQAELGAIARSIRARPYLRVVAVLVLLSTVTLTLVDFVFKSTVDRYIPAAEFGEFFSEIYLLLNVLSLVVQLLGVGWLLRRLGVNTVHAIAPAALLIGAAGVAATGGLAAALILKGADGSLRHSLHRTATELLFVPVRMDFRARVKTVIDTVGQRGGQAIASLLILFVLTVTTLESVIAGVAVLTATAWLMTSLRLRRHYLDTFRETLREEVTETRIAFPALDLASLETLLSTLSDTDDRKVLAALDLLAAQGKARVIPALILYHPSPAVVVRALDIFVQERRDDCLPIVDRLLMHADSGVVAAAVRAAAALKPDEQTLRTMLDHRAPEVRATAVVALAASGWIRDDALAPHVARVVDDGSSAVVALLRTVVLLPHAGLGPFLVRLGESPDPHVRIEAVRAMGAVGSPTFVEPLITCIAQRAVRGESRAALLAIGPPALEHLGQALQDQTLPHAIRRHLPRALAAFGSRRAAELLAGHLVREADGMIRFKILRALGRLRAEHPGVPIDRAALTEAFNFTLGAAYRFMRWRRVLEHGAAEDPSRTTAVQTTLVMLLRDKQVHAVERLFRLLNLLADNEEFSHIHVGLLSDRPIAQAGSRELIMHLVPLPMREPLLGLVDDLYDPSVEPDRTELEASYADTVRELATGAIESLSLFAMTHAAELGMRDLLSGQRTRPEFSTFHAQVLERARADVVGTGAGGPR